MKNKSEFIEKVRDEIAKLEKNIALYQELTSPISPDNAIGRVSRMDAINNKSVNEAALREAENRFKKLCLVLDSVNNPDFGICINCKQPIPEGRLLIRPESVLCVKCAQ